MLPHLHTKTPLTIMNELRGTRGTTTVGLGGEYHNWCSSFMGRMTAREISELRADLFIMSTSAIIDDICFHQTHETVDVNRAMCESASKRILLVDGTKFEKRALLVMLPLSAFDAVIVDASTSATEINRLRDKCIHVQVARRLNNSRF